MSWQDKALLKETSQKIFIKNAEIKENNLKFKVLNFPNFNNLIC